MSKSFRRRNLFIVCLTALALVLCSFSGCIYSLRAELKSFSGFQSKEEIWLPETFEKAFLLLPEEITVYGSEGELNLNEDKESKMAYVTDAVKLAFDTMDTDKIGETAQYLMDSEKLPGEKQRIAAYFYGTKYLNPLVEEQKYADVKLTGFDNINEALVRGWYDLEQPPEPWLFYGLNVLDDGNVTDDYLFNYFSGKGFKEILADSGELEGDELEAYLTAVELLDERYPEKLFDGEKVFATVKTIKKLDGRTYDVMLQAFKKYSELYPEKLFDGKNVSTTVKAIENLDGSIYDILSKAFKEYAEPIIKEFDGRFESSDLNIKDKEINKFKWYLFLKFKNTALVKSLDNKTPASDNLLEYIQRAYLFNKFPKLSGCFSTDSYNFKSSKTIKALKPYFGKAKNKEYVNYTGSKEWTLETVAKTVDKHKGFLGAFAEPKTILYYGEKGENKTKYDIRDYISFDKVTFTNDPMCARYYLYVSVTHELTTTFSNEYRTADGYSTSYVLTIIDLKKGEAVALDAWISDPPDEIYLADSEPAYYASLEDGKNGDKIKKWVEKYAKK